MILLSLLNGKLIKSGNNIKKAPCCCVGGCTNPYAVNYNSTAQCDDGSCRTCCTEGLCRLGDDCKGNDCNDLEGSGCCDSGCLPCIRFGPNDPPEGTPTGRDCSPSHDNLDTGNFIANGCDGNEIIYHDCVNCPGAVVPP
jgi:hypothetical protein